MAWVKVDDGFPEHPKAMNLSLAAKGLWIEGLCYSNRQLSDGFVPNAMLRRVGDDEAFGAIEELEAVVLWEVVDGGWQIHDYADYQRTRSEVQEVSAKRSEAGRLGAEATNRQRSGKLPATCRSVAEQPAGKPSPEKNKNKQKTEGEKQLGNIGFADIPVLDIASGSKSDERTETPLPPNWRPTTATWNRLKDELGVDDRWLAAQLAEFNENRDGNGAVARNWNAVFATEMERRFNGQPDRWRDGGETPMPDNWRPSDEAWDVFLAAHPGVDGDMLDDWTSRFISQEEGYTARDWDATWLKRMEDQYDCRANDGRLPLSSEPDYTADFERFWTVYPRKVAQAVAFGAWQRINPDPALTERIIAAVDAQIAAGVVKNDRFTPHPARWLDGRRWDDALPEPVQPDLRATIHQFPQRESRAGTAARVDAELDGLLARMNGASGLSQPESPIETTGSVLTSLEFRKDFAGGAA